MFPSVKVSVAHMTYLSTQNLTILSLSLSSLIHSPQKCPHLRIKPEPVPDEAKATVNTVYIPLHLLLPGPAGFLCGYPDYFWDSVETVLREGGRMGRYVSHVKTLKRN